MYKPLLLLALAGQLALAAQGQTLEQAFHEEVQFRQTGMLVLGAWAVINVTGGLVLRAQSTGATRYFHEMSALWNSVNLGIAALGYFQARGLSMPASAMELVELQYGLDKVLLFNAGLDLAYIAGGLYMLERSRRYSDVKRLRWQGYGRSVALQGAFLLCFDLALTAFHQPLHIADGVTCSLQVSPGALAMHITF